MLTTPVNHFFKIDIVSLQHGNFCLKTGRMELTVNVGGSKMIKVIPEKENQ
jgi:hypothetical protein